MDNDVFTDYKKKFGETPGIPFNASDQTMEKYKQVLRKCINEGKPYTADMFPEKHPEGGIL